MTLWEAMNDQERFRVKTNMRNHGGHFASHLAMAWMYADSTNERRIAETFPDMVERYQEKNWSTECADAQ